MAVPPACSGRPDGGAHARAIWRGSTYFSYSYSHDLHRRTSIQCDSKIFWSREGNKHHRRQCAPETVPNQVNENTVLVLTVEDILCWSINSLSDVSTLQYRCVVLQMNTVPVNKWVHVIKM
eukprot:scaffold629713_cov23-Prasinocladus_malaysianus.AAC.1